MPFVRAGQRRFDVDFVIFDKDGTLFDFRQMWARILRQQVEALVQVAGGGPAFFDAVYADMGTNPDGTQMDPRGPLALATYEEMRVIMTLALYRRGWAWDVALQQTADIVSTDRWPPLDSLVIPIGDLAGLFGNMRRAGLTIGVATTDVRAMTLAMLKLTAVDHLIDAVACADDGLALKPAPDAILALCRQVGVEPARTLMVGDAPTDMLAGRAAGVAGCVGVTTGVSRRADLEPFADVVLESLQALEVAPEPGTTGA